MTTANSAIGWTDATWSPLVGCTQISPGCAHCYAKTLHDQRHRAFTAGKLQNHPQYARPFDTVQHIGSRLLDPLAWRTPKRVFVNSQADVFHEHVVPEFVAAIWATMALAPHHTFQILTKRAARMRDLLTEPSFYGEVHRVAAQLRADRPALATVALEVDVDRPLSNVWLGVSIENQRFADRAAYLCETPAAVRFISAEPLLGAVDLLVVQPGVFASYQPIAQVDWVIVGGESGPEHRPMELAWLTQIVRDCREWNVPVFVKQDSGRRSGQWGRIPPEYRLQQFPRSLTHA